MIIFGMRVRHKVKGEGEFYCPRCKSQRAYLHKRATRYFTLYFVPLIPLGTLAEYVECQLCGTTFDLTVLNMKAPVKQRLPQINLPVLINDLPKLLATGLPVEYLVRDLNTGGLDRDVALKTIEPYLAAGRKTCPTCNLTYLASVMTCAECHKPLP
jgi:uncharacterized paraquat-inducible protein A